MTHSPKPSAWRRRTAAILMTLALAAPGSALADPGHPGHENFPAQAESSAQDEGGGGSSAIVIGGVLTGLVVLAGGLMYWREKQLGAASGGAAPTEADRAERREAKRQARSSW